MIRWIAAFALLTAATPSLAQESERPGPEVLSCIATGYSAENQAVIDTFQRNFDPLKDDSYGDEAFIEALIDRTSECVDLETVSEETIMMMVQHRLTAITLKVMKARHPEAYASFDAINTKVDPDTKERLYRVVELGVFPDPVTGQMRQPSEEDIANFEATMLSPPINATDETAEAIGSLMAAQMMQQAALAYFNN